MFLYKPIEVIEKTPEITTQWDTAIVTYPLQHHHESQFSWGKSDYKKRLLLTYISVK